jgi:hypothetical protein
MKISGLIVSTLTGIALLVLTNAIVLGGVYYNRSGDAARRIMLTERELGLPYKYGINHENSGIALRLNYRVVTGREHKYYFSGTGSPVWFDREKLAELGYGVSSPLANEQGRQAYKKMRNREALLVLEYNGATYQTALASAQQNMLEKQQQLERDPHSEIYKNQLKSARQMLEREQTWNSRLFVIDVGSDEEALRKKYADSSRYIIATGKVGIAISAVKDRQWEVIGTIRSLSIKEITVPWKYRSLFESILDRPRVTRLLQQAPRYQVSIAYGKRLEPWLVGAAELAGSQ